MKREQPLIFVRVGAYAKVRAHLAGDMDVEQGGLLVGKALYDPELGGYLLLIEEALPAQEGIETPTSFSYTSASWEALTPRLQALNLFATKVTDEGLEPLVSLKSLRVLNLGSIRRMTA